MSVWRAQLEKDEKGIAERVKAGELQSFTAYSTHRSCF
jgi:hypothetical protein